MPIDKVLLKRYKVIKAIGGGAFGNTYLATDMAFPGEPHRVVKHLCPQNDDPENVEIAKRLFKTEAECLAKLGEHDQIPRLFSYFEEDEEFYLVQELVEGHTLTQEFQPGTRWSEAKTVKFLQELLEILSVVHQKNTIHRDLKPANIMRRHKDGKLVLIDFGAVKKILTVNQHGATSLSRTVGIGTGGYLPPEQAMGRPGKYSDIYAVGVLGIQALTGLPSLELPQDSESLEQLWNDLKIQVDPQLKNVLERMVSYQYKLRFADAVVALKAFVPTEFNPPENNSNNSATKKRLLTVSGVIALAGAGIFGWRFIDPPNYAPPEIHLQNQGSQQADAETYKKQGKLHFDQGKLDLALADYNQAISLNPNDADAYSKRGAVHFDQEKPDLAFADFNQAIKLDPNDAKAYYFRGAVYSLQEKPDLAFADFNQAIKLDPNDAKAYYFRGVFYFRQEKLDLALADYNQAIALDPNYASAYYHRGNVYMRQGKPEFALADFNQAIKLNPNFAEAYGYLGLLYMNMRNIKAAKTNLQKAHELLTAQGNGNTAVAKRIADILQQLP